MMDLDVYATYLTQGFLTLLALFLLFVLVSAVHDLLYKDLAPIPKDISWDDHVEQALNVANSHSKMKD